MTPSETGRVIDDLGNDAGDGLGLEASHRAALDLGSLGLDPLTTALAAL